MHPAERIPGLRGDQSWAMPYRLNMAQQCLSQPGHQVAIVDLTGPERVDVTYDMLGAQVDAIAHALKTRIAPGDRVGVLLSQSHWCAAAHLAIWKIGAMCWVI